MSLIIQDLSRFGPERCEPVSPEEAAAYTRRLAESHPENFHVISHLLPRSLRADFANVYAFCRWSDDLADEAGGAEKSLALLDWWSRELADCYAGQVRHPVFVALLPTIRRHDLPIGPFEDLIDAFRQDQRVGRYQSWSQLLDYCRRSANPVGRLVMMMCGYREDRLLNLSDQTCTGLQLANHWQDVRRDLIERNRIYIPQEVASIHGLDVEAMARFVGDGQAEAPISDDLQSSYRETLRELVDRTMPLFAEGRALWGMVGPEVRPVLRLFTLGGEAVLQSIARDNYITLQRRPQLSRWTKLGILARVWLRAKWERQ